MEVVIVERERAVLGVNMGRPIVTNGAFATRSSQITLRTCYTDAWDINVQTGVGCPHISDGVASWHFCCQIIQINMKNNSLSSRLTATY